MTCKEFVDFLMSYLDRELSEAAHSDFEGHIGDCPSCATYLDQYRETVRLGKTICADPAGPVPEDVPEQLVAAVLAARRHEA